MSYLFDTTVAIDWSLGYPGIREVVEACFEETGLLYTCDVVTCEALSGGTDEEREVIRRFLTVLEYVALDPDGAASAGELRRVTGRSTGHSLGDALIAALAQRLGATVVTRNAADYAAFEIPVLGYGSAWRAGSSSPARRSAHEVPAEAALDAEVSARDR